MSQPAGSQPEFEAVSPVFPVSDVPAALTFYCERLCFDLGWTWGDPPTHANVCRGRISLSFTLDPSGAGSGNAYVELSGVDAYFAELRDRNLILDEVADRPYGMRDFSVTDPSGNALCSASR
jgi:catechol 2,3-dioxygenase-like lactoylglutathione lyase family enzyme